LSLFLFAAVFFVACARKEEVPAANAPAPEAKPAVQAAALPPNSWQVPVDVTPAPPPNPPQTNYLNLGWQTFVALSWPAKSPASGGHNAEPDTSSTIGATASNGAFVPTVWATYRDLDTVFLNNGTDPGASYDQPVSIPSQCTPIGSNPVAPGFQPMFVNASTFQTATIVKDYINQATNNPLVDQKGWYTFTDVRIDPSEYNYIHQNAYYLGTNQAAAYAKNGQLAAFPRTGTESGYPTLPPYAQYGALEIKSAWRVLDPATDAAVIPRYYTQWGYFLQPDGQTCQGPALFGLIALHILRLTPSTGATWFWASFEQVDNTEPPQGVPATLAAAGTPNGNCTSSYNQGPSPVTGNIPWNNQNKPNNICQVTNIPADVQQVNQTWQQNLSGTVWQYYQMVNTLNPCPQGAQGCSQFPPINDPTNLVNTNIFANTAVESYFQSHSCMDCHGFADGDGAPSTLTGTNQIFTFVLQNAYYPQTTAATSKKAKTLKATFKNPPFSKMTAPKTTTPNK
jgi:hypothetical protein